MSSEDELVEVRADLARLINDKDYRSFRDTIERLSILANAQYQGQAVASAAEIRGLLEEVSRMQKRIKDGTNPRELYQEVSQSTETKTGDVDAGTKDRMVALGDAFKANDDIIQAERDVYKAEHITINHRVLLHGGIDEAKRALDRIMVQVVLLVMTAREASELDAEHLSELLSTSTGLHQSATSPTLTPAKIEELLHRYGKTPEDWRPFTDTEETISQLVTQRLAGITDFKKPLTPDFIDVRQLADDTSERGFRDSLKLLRHEGCIVIMDIISLHHKVIQRAYRRSLLDVYTNIPAIRMAPTGSIQIFDEQVMLTFEERYREMEIYKRLNWDEDDLCRNVSDPGALGRWIKGRVPEMLKRKDHYKLAQANVQSAYKEPRD